MIRPANSDLSDHYRDIESAYSIVDGQADWANLVVPNGNAAQPIHGWFHFKEGYSHRLLERVWAYAGDGDHKDGSPRSVLDPFSGSGTTAVSAIALNRSAGLSSPIHSIERNPVMHLVSSAKVAGAARGVELAERVRTHTDGFWRRVEADLRGSAAAGPTGSVTLDNPHYYSRDAVSALMALARSARLVPDVEVQNHLLALTAACVEPAGMLRRDGRALRFTPTKKVREPSKLLKELLARSLTELDEIESPYPGDVAVHLGDARDHEAVDRSNFDWAVYSPPYPNNIDYTEVYKIEAWALGYFSTAEDMRAQRLRTLRSHPSVLFPDEYGYEAQTAVAGEVDSLLKPLLASIPIDRYTRGREQLVRGYADDMLAVLQQNAHRLKDGGKTAIIVGNSLHGAKEHHFLVASDLIIARLGELAGFSVDSVVVARRPQRRTGTEPMLRDSVVFLTRNTRT